MLFSACLPYLQGALACEPHVLHLRCQAAALNSFYLVCQIAGDVDCNLSLTLFGQSFDDSREITGSRSAAAAM